ncbi:MAG: adenosine deaminase [Deltaproteobacteria bacterium]|nr:adenosine deaminase [Deltaproteobacteria bacterium]
MKTNGHDDDDGAAVSKSGRKKVTKELLLRLPKTDLHCHLDGSLRLTTILELAQQQKVKLPAGAETKEGLAKAIHLGERCKDLPEYLKAFDITCSVLQTEEALERTAYELASDAAAENVWHLEVRYAPILHTRRGLSLTRINDAVLHGLRRASREHQITTGVILCGIRNMDPRDSYRLAELAVAFKGRGVVAFDLAGGERGNPAKDHAKAFELIRENNMNTTVHAGEAYGPASIKQALHDCGAHRIGHGTRLSEDGDLLKYVTDRRIPLEICLLSNVQTSVVDDLARHPLRLYFDLGVRVSLNTDNRLITDTTVTDELWRAHVDLGFTLEELKILLVQGFKSAFLPYREKRELLQRVNDALADITGSLPKGAVLAREVDVDEELREAFTPVEPRDTDRV